MAKVSVFYESLVRREVTEKKAYELNDIGGNEPSFVIVELRVLYCRANILCAKKKKQQKTNKKNLIRNYTSGARVAYFPYPY